MMCGWQRTRSVHVLYCALRVAAFGLLTGTPHWPLASLVHCCQGHLLQRTRRNDGSVPFFTAASELFTVAATTAAESVPSAAAAAGGDQAPPSLTPEESTLIAVRLMRSPQVSSIQEWCRHGKQASAHLPCMEATNLGIPRGRATPHLHVLHTGARRNQLGVNW